MAESHLIMLMEPRVAIGERVWNETEVAGATNAWPTAKKAASAARRASRGAICQRSLGLKVALSGGKGE